ncbi:MAG: DUF3144 domain-containing protein [Rhodocyclaceae bacterium]|nr:DUF3144 domain-containing protein [Rhodocyclaceae bacterium]
MPDTTDAQFCQHADEHIRMSKRQLAQFPARGEVSASMLHGTARFNARVSATGFDTQLQMAAARADRIEYSVAQYRQMPDPSIDNYRRNFDRHMATAQNR